MPLKLDIKRKLCARSDRVKSVDMHPSEPWMLVSLYNGHVNIWNIETQAIVKNFELCDLPVRAVAFIARKSWIACGSDDMHIRVLNYNTQETVKQFEAHSDYIRCIAVHPTQSYILTSSDDMVIKLWDWDRQWTCTQIFEGHVHYVMQIKINPKDNNTFASASLDKTVKVWQLGSPTPNFTLEGHERGVNCIDYYTGGDKPYLISGSDDKDCKIWDYQNKTCVQTLQGHTANISCVTFHPELPIILTGSEDGTVRIWHANTYRPEATLNYGLERAWTISCQSGTNNVAVGYDDGSMVITMGREEPAMSMDANGKIIWAKHSEIQQANIKSLADQDIKDGERLPLALKDMGSCEIYPQSVEHNPNGRFVTVCGDGEYIIYTAMALRNKSFGSAQQFVWSNDASQYATREDTYCVKLFKNFNETASFRPDGGAEGIFGGQVLGVKSVNGLSFFDWESKDLIRRIEISPKNIFWNDSGELVCIATDSTFFILKYSAKAVEKAKASNEDIDDDGIEDAFDVMGEVEEVVKTGCWVGDCFIYTNTVNRLNYYVGGEIVTVAHLDRMMYLLGYIAKDNRLYLADKDLNVVSYSLLLSVLEYQTAIMRKDFETANQVLPTISKDQRNRVAHFLEKQSFKEQALMVTCDPEHRFELALQLGKLEAAYEVARDQDDQLKWRQLGELAMNQCAFRMAEEALQRAQDFGGLLLLSTSAGNEDGVLQLAKMAREAEQNNVSFLSYFTIGRLEECLELLISTRRLPEAAFFARTYLPSQISRVVGLWKESVAKVNQKAAESLADPAEYENLFEGLTEALRTEKFLEQDRHRRFPASAYPQIPNNAERNIQEEMAASKFDPSASSAAAEKPAGDSPSSPPARGAVASSSAQEEVTSPPGAMAAAAADDAGQSAKDLENELELDLENLSVDENIDTSEFNDLLED